MGHPTRVSLPPRKYTGHNDLLRMQKLLMAGRRAQNGSYYVHVGDLSWWLYYIDPAHDLIVIAPDGHIASFYIIWLDEVNQVGLFEPVSTHPDFQHKGLEKAIMLIGLQRMKVKGMQKAIEITEHDNLAAQWLYRAVGFQENSRLTTFVKKLA